MALPTLDAAFVFKPALHEPESSPNEGDLRHLAKTFDDALPPQTDTVGSDIRQKVVPLLNEASKVAFNKGVAAQKVASPATSASEKNIWPWALTAGIISAAAAALIVWAIYHSHDKKLLAKLAAANAQNN